MREEKARLLERILADMREASDAVDAANGTSDYNARLVALARVTRHYLRRLDEEEPERDES